MTFAEAMEATKRGKSVTHPGYNHGWKIFWSGKSAFFRNPITGSEYQATFDDKDKARTDWEIVR